MARLLAPTAVTPNGVTLLTLIPAAISAWSFKRGNFQGALGGCIFFYLWSVLDHADGELARAKNCANRGGEKLDDLCDVISSSFILFGIFFGLLPFWNEKDSALFKNIFFTGFFLNTTMGILISSKRKRAPVGKWLNHFAGRDPFYALLWLVLVTFVWGGAFWYSLTMTALLGGLYLVAGVSIGIALFFK